MPEHYFSESPASQMQPREIEVTLGGAPRTVLTAAGVFSGEHLDQGTAILLRALESDNAAFTNEVDGPILDLGCGWGPIALAAALAHPEAEVWAVDINERARELTRLNAERLGLSHVRAVHPDEVPAELSFGAIHSNPPIRVGKVALHDMLAQWLPRLAPGASAHLVVAKHLGADSLQRWIAETFAELSVSRNHRDKGFHIISALRAPDAHADAGA